MNQTKLLRSVAICWMVFCTMTFATTEVAAPTKRDLVGDWIGFDDYAATFYRLKISTNDCRLATTYPKQPLAIYKPSRWSLSGGKMEFTTTSAEGEPLHFQGTSEFNRIKAKLSGTTRTWTQDITFFREERIVPRLSEIRNKMEAIEDSPK
jgi:hypothetical protein